MDWIHFTLIALEISLELDWSPRVWNSIDWTWFVFWVPQFPVRTKNQAAKPKELDHCNQVVLRRRCGKGCKTVSKAGYLFPGARCAPSLWNGKNWEPPRQTQWQGKKGLGQRGSHCNTFGKKNYKNVFSLVIVGCVKNKVNLINSKLNLQHNKVWNKWKGLKTFQSHFTVFELCSYCFLP